MLTVELPTLLALLGTALMAVVIFAPAPAAAKATAFAPPLVPGPTERRDRDVRPFAAQQGEGLPEWSAMVDHVSPLREATRTEPFPALDRANATEIGFANDALPLDSVACPAWPALLDASAVHCDATARLKLVAALAAVRTPWSDDVLRCALAEDGDPLVRDAVAAALAMS